MAKRHRWKPRSSTGYPLRLPRLSSGYQPGDLIVGYVTDESGARIGGAFWSRDPRTIRWEIDRRLATRVVPGTT